MFYPFGAGPAEIEFGDGFEMVAIARNLAAQGAFANPFLVDKTGPTAVVPPLYPLVLAALTKLLGSQMLVSMAAVIGAISANALIASWLPRVSTLFYGGPIPGVIAALFWLVTARLMPSWDTSFTIAGLLLLCLFSASSVKRTAGGALAGMIIGIIGLLNPSSMLVSLPWVVYLLARSGTPWKHAARYGSALLGSVFLVLSVWALRNYRELGAPVLRTNLGMTLYASNNDCAESSLVEDARLGCYQSHHPNNSLSEARLLAAMGEVEYDANASRTQNAGCQLTPVAFGC